jgi:hypothetical protein
MDADVATGIETSAMTLALNNYIIAGLIPGLGLL